MISTKTMSIICTLAASILVSCFAARIATASPANSEIEDERQGLTAYFTAKTLRKGQTKIGFESGYGLTEKVSITIDTIPLAAGAPNLTTKVSAWSDRKNTVSLALGYSYLSRESGLWGGLKSQFDELEASIFRPQLSWTRWLSERLLLHTHWSLGLGDLNATLSEEGRRDLWRAKYPGGDYDTRSKNSEDTDGNQAEVDANYSLSHRGLQVQSLLGFSRDFFQITGEFHRSGNKIVVIGTRIDQVNIEDLEAKNIRITLAQEWAFDRFHVRLGGGLQYQVLSGQDLDGEEVSDSGIQPVADIDLYWLL